MTSVISSNFVARVTIIQAMRRKQVFTCPEQVYREHSHSLQ